MILCPVVVKAFIRNNLFYVLINTGSLLWSEGATVAGNNLRGAVYSVCAPDMPPPYPAATPPLLISRFAAISVG
jgi:hypothetical protein